MTKWMVVVIAFAACGKGDGTAAKNEKPSVEAFSDYKHKSMASEGKLYANKLAKLAKIAASEKGAFPSVSAPLTPTTDCCKNPDHKCTPDPTTWTGEPWKTLEFSIDEPSRYRFLYNASPDGKGFTAVAQADLECDGKAVSHFTVNGSIDPTGQPQTAITPEW